MEQLNILQIAITALLGYLSINGKMLINKISKIEKKMEDLVINSVGDKKDIEVLRRDVNNHETRILKLEK